MKRLKKIYMPPLYSPHERDVLGNLSLRLLCFMDRIGSLISGGPLDGTEYDISLEELEGAGFDEADLEMLDFRLRELVRAGMLASFAIDQSHDAVRLAFEPECMGLARHFAKTGKRQEGPGALRGTAMLALKRAFKIRSDVYYTEGFDTENFNFGEDISYLDDAFHGYWRMDFGDEPEKFMRREICVFPQDDDDGLAVTQEIHYRLPGNLDIQSHWLCDVSLQDFTTPEIWRKRIPQILRAAEESLAKARERLREMQEVEGEDGQIINKAELLENMRKACRNSGRLARFFNCDPPVRTSPEWPLDSEPHGCFREFSCDLESFMRKFPHFAKWDIRRFLGGLWLRILRQRHGIEPEKLELEEYGKAGAADNLRERLPDLAADIEPEYQQSVKKARIRVAWGLFSHRFQNVLAFVDAVISHPEEEEMRIGDIGWNYISKLNYEKLLAGLDEAEKNASRH